MDKITSRIFNNQSCGASMLEVLLAMAIVATATPFVYSQIARTNQTIHDVAVAHRITETRDNVLNFVRMNQDKWPDAAQIKLADEELATISDFPTAGFIDKYTVNGAAITDVYLAFDLQDTNLRTSQIAKHIGSDAAVVGDDGVAFGDMWAVSAPGFNAGNLIYRISRDVAGEDTSKYLHRGTSGEDNLNVMGRDLDMNSYNVYNVATLTAKSTQTKNANATFVESDSIAANTVYFSSGATIESDDVTLGAVRVSGDVSGFRNIYAMDMNGRGYTTSGRIITDRAQITGSVNVANDLIMKSSSSRTVSGFTGITVNSVMAPYVTAEEMIFYDNFGLTISGELFMSTTSPLKIGSWIFPSTKPPQFSNFTLARAKLPTPVSKNEFKPLMNSGWKTTVVSVISR